LRQHEPLYEQHDFQTELLEQVFEIKRVLDEKVLNLSSDHNQNCDLKENGSFEVVDGT